MVAPGLHMELRAEETATIAQKQTKNGIVWNLWKLATAF